MRPLVKPPPPRPPRIATQGGTPREPLEIVRCALQDTIGGYCSFCEMPVYVEEGVASRHSRNLAGVPELAAWDTLLLACDWCRHFRTSDVSDASLYSWPDLDATFVLAGSSPFTYALRDVDHVITTPNGTVLQRSKQTFSLVSASDRRAQNTIALFQLNTPSYDEGSNQFTVASASSAADRRVELRTRAWALAQKSAAALEDAKRSSEPHAYAAMAPLVASLAQATGFWSIWMTVLWDAMHDRDVLRDVLLETHDRTQYQITGYQTFPNGGAPPWKIFPGTAIDRIAF